MVRRPGRERRLLLLAVGAVIITALADRIGRKPPVVVGGLMMAIGPLALLHVDGSPALLA